MADQEKKPPESTERFFVQPAEGDPDGKKLEDSLIEWINDIRKKHGFPPLEPDVAREEAKKL